MADPFFEPDQGIAATASISPVSPILPIVGIPRIAMTNAPTGNEFRVDNLPAKVQELFNKKGNPWLEALDEAVLGTAKLKDLNLLADLIFFMQHSERMKDGVGKLIDKKADADFIRLRAEWNHYRTIANCRLHPSTVPDVFLSEHVSSSYEDFVAKQTTGNITLMVNGRNRRGTRDIDNKVDAFDSMQQTVESLGPNDSIYLTAWQFNPILVPLTQTRPSLAHWGELFKKKAEEGVKIRIIITIHPDLAYYFNSDLAALEGLIYLLPPPKRDNFKFIASRHPAKESFPGLGTTFVGDHHQKFMVVKKGKMTIAYCGGLDISYVRTPNAGAGWSDNFVWHDIHAKLEGLIAKDIEREFVLRWNREKDKAKTSKIPKIKNPWKASMLLGWKDFEKLDLTPVGSVNKNSRNNAHKLQMLRTVSFGATIQDNKRDDIWQGYFKLIARAKTFLYLENQYFHEPKLADAIVKQMQAQSNLIVIIVVTTGTDDRPNEWYKHCLTVRHKFFTSLLKEKSLSNRIGVYTMFYTGGIVHSKLILVDDQVLSIGSANANQRGFFVDTELNVMLEHAETVKNFRQQLWSHNLGLPLKIVARWDVSDYISNWDRVADRNKSLEKDINKTTKEDLKKSLEKVIPLMVGEGIIRFDPLARKDPGSHDPKDPRSEIDIMQDMSWLIPDIMC
jgi:phosphatidylserine/phosphatidylglycerophosphate/cardiolipin synthase-like enzyme